MKQVGKLEKMTKKVNLEYFRAKGLLPFQAEFSLNFLESEDKRYWEFASSSGIGKNRLGSVLVLHLLEEDPNRRILILSTPLLLMQWKLEIESLLTSAKLPYSPIIVDRKTYLELESNVTFDKSPWPIPAVILMSVDLAKRDDMASNLKSVNWDLIIFDESHLLKKGKRKVLFDELRESKAAHRGLLLTTIPAFPDNVDTKSVGWDVVDWEGRPVFPSFEKKLTSIYYKRSEEEHSFYKDLKSFTEKLTQSFSYAKLQQASIFRAASSSIYAVERMLGRLFSEWRHLRNKIAHGIPWSDDDIEKVQKQLIMATDELGVVEELSESLVIEPNEFLFLYQKLEALLDQVEEIHIDSKLDALISYTRKFFDIGNKTHLCIWCSFANTLQYLESSLESLEEPIYSLSGSLEPSELKNRLESFQNNGGILITTDVSSKGLTFEYVDECINYDLPLNAKILYLRWTRFHRISRKKDFSMSFIKDESKALPWEEELVKTLEDSISSEAESGAPIKL